jgi:hypothetical protein
LPERFHAADLARQRYVETADWDEIDGGGMERATERFGGELT